MKIKEIEKKYGLDFGNDSEIEVDDYLRKKGYKSLADMLKKKKYESKTSRPRKKTSRT